MEVRRAAPGDVDGCVRIVAGLTDHSSADGVIVVGVEYVTVKTLDGSHPSPAYAATRAFWERHGFVQIDAIDPYPGWRPGNPAAVYVRALG